MARKLRAAALLLLALALPPLAAADPPLSAPLPDAALEAYIADRFVAVARPGKGRADLSAALARGVAAGQVKGAGAGAAHAPDLTNADLGVVSFKFSNTPASPQAANQVRLARWAPAVPRVAPRSRARSL
jgi:hypothetical protein